MSKQYGEFEQINGAIANGLIEDCIKLENLLLEQGEENLRLKREIKDQAVKPISVSTCSYKTVKDNEGMVSIATTILYSDGSVKEQISCTHEFVVIKEADQS